MIVKGDVGTPVAELQSKLNKYFNKEVLRIDGEFGGQTDHYLKKFQAEKGLVADGIAGPLTMAALESKAPAPISEPVESAGNAPWMEEAKKHLGKNESDPEFNKKVSAYWKLVGLPGYKTIKGNTYAWCAVFIVMVASAGGGYKYAGTASAKRQGQASESIYHSIDWRKNGAPSGAVAHINHSGECNAGSGNHVAFVSGDCTAEDLNKRGAEIALLGGNQNNRVSRVNYPVAHLCEVRFFKEQTVNGAVIKIPMPGKVLKSQNCTVKGSSGGSTQ